MLAIHMVCLCSTSLRFSEKFKGYRLRHDPPCMGARFMGARDTKLKLGPTLYSQMVQHPYSCYPDGELKGMAPSDMTHHACTEPT